MSFVALVGFQKRFELHFKEGSRVRHTRECRVIHTEKHDPREKFNSTLKILLLRECQSHRCAPRLQKHESEQLDVLGKR